MLESRKIFADRVSAHYGLLWGKTVTDGRYELFVMDDGRLFSIDFDTSPRSRFSERRPIDFDISGHTGIDSLLDGRFIAVRMPETDLGAAELCLVLNWTQELSRLVPSNGN